MKLSQANFSTEIIENIRANLDYLHLLVYLWPEISPKSKISAFPTLNYHSQSDHDKVLNQLSNDLSFCTCVKFHECLLYSVDVFVSLLLLNLFSIVH